MSRDIATMIKIVMAKLYHSCATQYMRLFVILKLFQLQASNRWSDCSFKDLLTLLMDTLPQGNVHPETLYEAK
jgi:hypothetical protein